MKISEPERDQDHVLPGGRRLRFRTYGAGGGPTVLYFHGFPGSRLEPALLGPELDAWTGTMIAVDRPGIGGSDRDPSSAPERFASDLIGLLDARGLSRVTVLGVSGGAPWAVGFAAHAPDRVHALGLVGGLAPADPAAPFADMSAVPRHALGLLRRRPGLAAPLARTFGTFLRLAPATWVGLVARITPEPDRSLLREQAVRTRVASSFLEHAAGGGHGTAIDLKLYASAWDVPRLPDELPVHVWHGARDGTVPPTSMQRLAGLARSPAQHLLDEEAHFSLPVKHWPQILDDLDRARIA